MKMQIRVSKVRRGSGLQLDNEFRVVNPMPPLSYLQIDNDIGPHASVGSIGDKGHVLGPHHGSYSALLPVLRANIEYGAKNEVKVKDETHNCLVIYPPGTRIRFVEGAWKAVLPRGVSVPLTYS